MILTPIPSERLPQVLRQFRGDLTDAFARRVLDAISTTGADRAEGEAAEQHRHQAEALAHELGMGIARESSMRLSWDGEKLNVETEAFVLTHEVAHFQLASPRRR